MTKEQYQNKLEELSEKINAHVQEYNALYGEQKIDEAGKVNAETEKEVDEYNQISQTLCFDDCCEAADPMMAAVLKLSFPVVSVRDTFEGEGEHKVLKRIRTDRDRQIDPLKLQKYAKENKHLDGGIGKDKQWNNMIDRLNLLFSMDCAVEIGKRDEFLNEMKDCYAINQISKDIDLGVKDPKAEKPISNTGLLKAVSKTVSAMIGEEYGKKVLTHDVRFLKIASAQKSKKALTVQCANPKKMRGFLMEVCNRIVTDGKYDVDYKKIKNK